MSFSLSKVDLDSVFETSHRDRGVEELDVQHSLWKIHLVNFFAVDREEHLLRSEDIAYSDSSSLFLEIDVNERA